MLYNLLKEANSVVLCYFRDLLTKITYNFNVAKYSCLAIAIFVPIQIILFYKSNADCNKMQSTFKLLLATHFVVASFSLNCVKLMN